MKPVFPMEKQFIEENLDIELPDCCWRDSSRIYLNCDDKRLKSKPIVKFRVENGKMILKTNDIKDIKKNSVILLNKKDIVERENLSFDMEAKNHSPRLDLLVQESSLMLMEFLWKHYDYDEIRIEYSGGKDSDVNLDISSKTLSYMGINDYKIDYNNPTNETGETYKHVKSLSKDKLIIHTPSVGWYEWLTEVKDYYLPTVNVRNCCSNYKEGRLKDYLDADKKYILIYGMRKDESPDRSKYEFDLNKSMGKKCNVPLNWMRILPVLNWLGEDIWLYIIREKKIVNEMYQMGFNRTGCLICPYMQDYNDLLIKKYYPFLWNRWLKILEVNYEKMDVKNRLKWSLEEWQNGRWKEGVSREYNLIKLKPTEERIKELAEIKGISEDIARIYFKRQCSCGHKLNPDEIAMNLKIYGRGMDVGKMQCKKCMKKSLDWSDDYYKEQVRSFRKQGCNLF